MPAAVSGSDRPNRRRRWLAILFIALILLGVQWSVRQGDSRFTGHWKMSTVNKLGLPQNEDWSFGRFGWGSQRRLSSPVERKFAWRVEGDELLLETNWPRGWRGLRLMAWEISARLSGRPSLRTTHRLKMLLALPNEIQLTGFDAGIYEGLIMLRRDASR